MLHICVYVVNQIVQSEVQWTGYSEHLSVESLLRPSDIAIITIIITVRVVDTLQSG